MMSSAPVTVLPIGPSFNGQYATRAPRAEFAKSVKAQIAARAIVSVCLLLTMGFSF